MATVYIYYKMEIDMLKLTMVFYPSFLGIALLLQISELLKDSGDWKRVGKIDTRWLIT